jgi:hypothetical protein
MAKLETCPHHSPTKNGHQMASTVIPPILALEILPKKTGPETSGQRDSGFDQEDE